MFDDSCLTIGNKNIQIKIISFTTPCDQGTAGYSPDELHVPGLESATWGPQLSKRAMAQEEINSQKFITLLYSECIPHIPEKLLFLTFPHSLTVHENMTDRAIQGDSECNYWKFASTAFNLCSLCHLYKSAKVMHGILSTM